MNRSPFIKAILLLTLAVGFSASSAISTSAAICGINYYPKDKFQSMLQNWDSAQASYDMDVMVAMGIKTVRIFIPYAGGANYGGQFAEFLSIAQNKGLKVIPTLLDRSNFPCDWRIFKGNYRDNVRNYVEIGKNSSAIEMWDIKNEPGCGNNNTVLDNSSIEGLRWLAGIVKSIDNRPITVGLKSDHVEKIPQMLDFLDVVQIHDYWDIPKTIATAQRAKDLSNGKPVMLGEFGIPSSSGDQSSYYRNVLPALDSIGIAYISPWAFIDFTNEVGDESHYGLVDVNYNLKPGGDVFKTYCGGSGNIPTTPSPPNSPGGQQLTTTPVNGQCPDGYSLMHQPGTGTPPTPPDNNVGNNPIVPWCGINYYPTYHTWQRMWTEWDPNEIRSELGYAKEMGINMVRTFVPYYTFGAGNPNQTMINRLKEFVDIAGSLGIKSVIALFDYDGNPNRKPTPDPRPLCDYPKNPTPYNNQARAIITALDSNPNLLWWDVTNEPENSPCADSGNIDDALLIARYIKSLNPTKEITLGLRDISHYTLIKNSPYIDIIQFHSYWDPDNIKKGILDISKNTDKKIFLGEFGLPYGRTAPYGPYADGNGLDESDQTDYYNKVFDTALNDFKNYKPGVFNRIIGIAPWMLMEIQGSPDGNWGLIGPDLFINAPGMVYANKYCDARPPFKPVSADTGGTDICVLESFGSCPNPLGGANPEDGCYLCNLKGTASETSPICSIPIIGSICRGVRKLVVSFKGDININDAKSPITEENLDLWYAKVEDDGNIPNEESYGRLAYFLNPEDAKLATRPQQARIYKETKTRVDYDAQVEGMSASQGFGSTNGFVYGTQNATSIIECLLTGIPGDPECQNATPDIIARKNKYLISLGTAEHSTAKKTASSSNAAKGGADISSIIKNELKKYDKATLLASIEKISPNSARLANSNQNKVLGIGDTFSPCPPKENVSESPLCELAVEKPAVHSLSINNKECETTFTTDANGNTTSKTDCSHGDERKASFAPKFHFVTGKDEKGGLAIVPAITKIHSIFWPPGFKIDESTQLKSRNDGKVDFNISANFSDDPSVLGIVADAITKAILNIHTNSVKGANVENMKKAECMEQITTQDWLQNPLDALTIPSECLEPASRAPQQPLAGVCDNGDGGVMYWNNSVTTFDATSLNLSSPKAHLCGKILVKDADSNHIGVPLNPCQKGAKRDCGAGNTFAIKRLVCKNSRGEEVSAKPCAGRVNSGPIVPATGGDFGASECSNLLGNGIVCTVAKGDIEKGVADWKNAPKGIYNTIIDLDLPKEGPIKAGSSQMVPYVYQIFTRRACYVPVKSGWFTLGDSDTCLSMVDWSLPLKVPTAIGDPSHKGLSYDYCGIPEYNCKDEYDWGNCNDIVKDSWEQLLCLAARGGTRGGNGFGTYDYTSMASSTCSSCPNGEDLIPTRLADLRMYDISCADKDNCLVAANKVDSSGEEERGYIAKTNDGTAWNVKRVSYMEGADSVDLTAVYRVRLISPTTGWLVGKAAGNVINVILRTTDGGNTWVRQASEGLSSKNYTALDMLPNGTGAVGPSSSIGNTGILYTDNGGVGEVCSWNPNKWCPTWLEQDLTLSGQAPRYINTYNSALDISLYNEDNLMVASNGFVIYNIEKTAGGNWEITGNPVSSCSGPPHQNRMERVRMVSPNMGYAAGNHCPAKYENGRWEKLSGFPDTYFFGLDATAQTQIFSSEDGKIYVLHRGGSPAAIQLPNASGIKMWSVEIVGNTVYVGGDGGKIYKSQDSGATWAEVTTITMRFD